MSQIHSDEGERGAVLGLGGVRVVRNAWPARSCTIVFTRPKSSNAMIHVGTVGTL